ncbi:MAG: putative DNA binding domain-containing protein [Synergistaceae bacterium]|nr:putative DNA binding domain-containing protein [Synergistaceae bacterium]
MNPFENMNVEFKEIYLPEIKKDVVAFANTAGGELSVGIRKDGEIVGVADPDDVMLRLSSLLRDSIRPDVMPFVRIRAVERAEKIVIEITVSAGTSRPYYLQDKGLKPSGVYIRRGSASIPLSDEGIREMIMDNGGRSYEDCRSMEQQLTFQTLENELSARSIEFGASQMRTLRLVGDDGLYTNLAELLSDQCRHTIKTAIFQGKDKALFRDRREFSGSLLRQLREVYQLIDMNNKVKATFSGLERTDMRDYPEESLREALLNSIVHRDYSFSGSTLINIYDDRIEFVSLGGLVPGLSVEAIYMGVSQSRNPNLAALFYRMRLIESYGTGIGNILRLYRGEEKAPIFETAKGVFRVTLPNRNEGACETRLAESPPAASDEAPLTVKAGDEKKLLMLYAERHGGITRKEAEILLNARTTKAYMFLRQLCSDGRLRPDGQGKKSRYIPVE